MSQPNVPRHQAKHAATADSLACDLVKFWRKEDWDRFPAMVEDLLSQGRDDVLKAATEFVGVSTNASLELRADIMQITELFSHSLHKMGSIFCFAAEMAKPGAVDPKSLIRSYIEAAIPNQTEASFRFHEHWYPMSALMDASPSRLWFARENMRLDLPPFLQPFNVVDITGWYVLIGLRISPLVTEAVDLNAVAAAEQAWREHVLKTMPSLLDVIAPEVPSYVGRKWLNLIEQDDEADPDQATIIELQNLLAITQEEADEAVASIVVRATDEDWITIMLVGTSGRTIEEVVYPAFEDLSLATLEALSETLGVPVELTD